MNKSPLSIKTFEKVEGDMDVIYLPDLSPDVFALINDWLYRSKVEALYSERQFYNLF
jgi:hypothetical protein